MRRWLKRLRIGLTTALLFLVLVVAVEHVRGRWALSRRLKELEQRSESVSVRSVEPKHPLVDQNCFSDLINLTNRLATIGTKFGTLPPALRFTEPGRAIVLSDLKEWSPERKGTNDWNRAAATLRGERGVLGAIGAALRKPGYDSGFDYQKGFVDFNASQLVNVKLTANLLSAAVLCDLHETRLDEALGELRDLVQFTARQTPEPLVIAQLVRIGCAAMAFNATWQTLHAIGWTDTQLAAVQEAWERCDFVGDMAHAFEVERVLDIDFFEQIKHSRQKLAFALGQRDKTQEMMEGIGERGAAEMFFRRWLYLPLWRIAWADQDALNALNHWQRTIERARFVRTNFWTAVASQSGPSAEPLAEVPTGELDWYDRHRFLFSHDPFVVTDALVRRAFSAQTEQQLALAALGIERFRLRTGKLPPDLKALVPGYLHGSPKDWMDGKALRYRPLGEAGFVLYSVGEDGIDDGGDPMPRSNRKVFRKVWDGRDAVWPVAASALEAAQGMGSDNP